MRSRLQGSRGPYTLFARSFRTIRAAAIGQEAVMTQVAHNCLYGTDDAAWTSPAWGDEVMFRSFHDVCEGPIQGLRLPLIAWGALDRAGITTLDQLRAQVNGIQRFDGIGPKTARLLQQELARVSPNAEM